MWLEFRPMPPPVYMGRRIGEAWHSTAHVRQDETVSAIYCRINPPKRAAHEYDTCETSWGVIGFYGARACAPLNRPTNKQKHYTSRDRAAVSRMRGPADYRLDMAAVCIQHLPRSWTMYGCFNICRHNKQSIRKAVSLS